MRLLIVEDNKELAQHLAKGLRTANFDSDIRYTAADARLALTKKRYAAIILDLGLPDDDGLTMLREIKDRNDPVPVLVLTARGGVENRASGPSDGADSYLIKPYTFDELVGRLEALLRPPGHLLDRSLQIANLVFDSDGRQVYIRGKRYFFPEREAALLELLIRRKERVVSKRLVEDHLFGFVETVASNAVEVYIHRLRKLLSKHRVNVRIRTIRGVGYLLAQRK